VYKFIFLQLVKLKQHFSYFFTKIKIYFLYKKFKLIDLTNYNFDFFRINVLNFLDSNSKKKYEFYYSRSASSPTLYASAYACMTYGLLSGFDKIHNFKSKEWKEYFDSFQNETDGLFYDKVVENALFNNSDWWGARHLAVHMISAYTHLNERPKYQFVFLEKFYDIAYIKKWLDSYEWQSFQLCESDIDNKIMNIACLLQYQRDTWKDERASIAIEYLKEYLIKKININTGVWGRFDDKNKWQISRIVQFAYHLYPLFFYDNYFDFDIEKIINLTLSTQNKFGGFGITYNSSACEDIDSIFILIKLYNFSCEKSKIDKALENSFRWILSNQVSDGGFVFKLGEPFLFGHVETSSRSNYGALFPTWFRVLSLIYILKHFQVIGNYKIVSCPGYEFN
jgi:hypothetical protein